jgi:hypothetical protein
MQMRNATIFQVCVNYFTFVAVSMQMVLEKNPRRRKKWLSLEKLSFSNIDYKSVDEIEFGIPEERKMPVSFVMWPAFSNVLKSSGAIGEDMQNFSHCFPEFEDSWFSETTVTYQITRIPRSEFWNVPASVNCDQV